MSKNSELFNSSNESMQVKTITYRLIVTDRESYVFSQHEQLEMTAELTENDNPEESALKLKKMVQSVFWNIKKPENTEGYTPRKQ